ncbi:Monocarboxylate transporter 12 [Tolypocladium ophioglossoides CBS 100239]|uniref:Monocarboxylate transporter 12 n=1 Tax=Tolypocladium ophioglossoides (strain CBS 100239) TaxID=1163406 RepID=A0A0L0NA17_TOLOC|nr:Monocarboxylate transporter 12 [Tolypocladium ophioglossoides CBS 100239]
MSIQLQPVSETPRVAQEAEEGQGHLVPVLPPTDEGPGAWKYLLGCFLVEALLWAGDMAGFPLAFGVFQEYYSRQPEFADNPNIAAIGTIATSIYFLGAPLAAPLVRRFQWWQQYIVAAGWAICAVSLLAASMVSSVSGLIATQGVLYGLGFLMLYFPVLSMLNEWFVQRRGLAYGVLCAGGGVSGAGLPFLLEWLLSTTGYRTTLRVIAIAQFVGLVPALLLLRPRLRPSSSGALRAVDLSFFRQPLFWFFALSNLFQGLGYYIPSLYLPTFASVLGLSGSMGTLILAFNNMACVIGQVAFGHLSDRYNNIHVLVFVSTFAAGLATLTIWGLVHSLAGLLAFSFIYGSFAGAYVVFWPKFGSLLSEDPQTIFSLMAFGKGIGNIVTGPISASLLKGPITSGYGLGKFEPLILFAGSFMILSSLEVVWLPLKHFMRRFPLQISR